MLHVLVLLAVLPLQQTLDRVEQYRLIGRPKDAIQLLDQVRHQDPTLFNRNNLLYLRSVLAEEAGQAAEAREGFEEVVKTDFPLPDLVLLHLISASNNLPLAGRRGYYEAFLARFPAHFRWTQTASDFADLLEDEGQTADASAWYRRIIASRKGLSRDSSLKLARLLLLYTNNSAARGDAITLLRSLIADSDDVALAAATELRKIEPTENLTEQDVYRRAVLFVNGRRSSIARIYLDLLLTRYPQSSAVPEYRYLVARNLQLEGNRRGAAGAYQAVYGDFPASSWGIMSEYQAGLLLLALGEYEEAAGLFDRILLNPAGGAYLDRAATNASDARIWMGDRARALQTLREALPKSKDPSPLHYYIARMNLEDEQYQAALDSLSRIAHLASDLLPSGVTREEVQYWKGLCEEQLGMVPASLLSYQEAVKGRPNYFAELARARLPAALLEQVLKAPTQVKSEVISDRLVPARSLIMGDPPVPAAVPQADLMRIQELLFLRLFDEAYGQLKRPESLRLFGQKSDYLFQLAQVADRGGLHRESLEAAEELREYLYGRTAPDFYPETIWQMLYPRHYWDLVCAFGDRYGVDPYLILALIRQESSFQPDAVSRASATGLMQLVPATARELAGKLKIRYRPGSLVEPETAIRLGTFYFRQLLDRYNGNLEKTLAAYNGGGTNVLRWENKMTSRDTRLFVANIGFRETKLYVSRVLGNYWTYRRLYSKER